MDMNDELLTIKQASEVLQVSEASLRRWTASGRLPCLRVGGRRERRFTRADLMRLLESPANPVMAERREQSAVASDDVVLELMRIPRGSHLCELYETDEGRLRLSVPFLSQGVARGEQCFLVSQPEVEEQILGAVRRNVPELDQAIQAGRLVIGRGTRDPMDMLNFFRRHFLKGSAKGISAFRVLGEMSCFVDRGASMDSLMEFELRYNQGLGRDFPVVSLCQYDARRFSGITVLQACRAHDDMLKFPLRSLLGI